MKELKINTISATELTRNERRYVSAVIACILLLIIAALASAILDIYAGRIPLLPSALAVLWIGWKIKSKISQHERRNEKTL